MKSSRPLVYGLLAITAALPAALAADLTGSIALGYNSIYEFRGVDLGSNMVEATASVGTEINGFGLSASAWYATVNDNAINTTPNELDMTLAITKSLGPVNLSGGYIYYSFFDASGLNTQELYLGASMEVYAGIAASTTLYYDFDLYTGLYADFNLSKTCEVNSCLKITTTVGLGWADDQNLQLKANGGALDGYQQWYAMVSVPWTPRENLTIAPYLRYVDADSELVSDYPGLSTGDNHFMAGIKLTLAF